MKKMLRMLVVSAMLLGLFVISASAAEVTCNGHNESDGWIPIKYDTAITDESQYGYKYDSTNRCIEIVAGGKYYLSQDITNCYISINRAKSTSVEVTLCLNGKNISGTSYGIRVGDYTTKAVLQNCQSSGGIVNGKGDRSLLLMPDSVVEMYDNVHLDNNTDKNRRNAIVQVNAGASFAMYGGTISNNLFSTNGANAGNMAAVLCSLSGSTVNLQGGKISGNTVTATADTDYLAPILINNGTLAISESFLLDGNTVIDPQNYCDSKSASGVLAIGSAPSITMTGGIISNNKGGCSGGVQLRAGSFTMSGGTISGNQADQYGGGVDLHGGTMTMSGGTITGNQADQYGGGVDLRGGTMTMSGGTISNNKLTSSQPYGTQVAVRYYASNCFAMTGGTISADDTVSSNDLTVVRGTVAVSGGTITGNVGTVGVGATAELNINGGTITGTVSNGEIVHPGIGSHEICTTTVSGGKFSDDTELTVLESWLASGVTLETVTENGATFYKAELLSCDGSHSSDWTVLNKQGSLISSYYYPDGQTISTSGNYYLKANITGSVTADGGTSCAINVTADNVTLCLAGYSVKPSTSGVVAIRCAGKNLKIITTSSGGLITGNNAVSILVEPGCSVQIGNNVHIDGASITASGTTAAPVVVNEDGSFALRGGTISGNTVTSTLADSYVGGAIAATNATVILEAGTISGNTVSQTGTNGFGSGAVTMNGGTMNVSKHILIDGNKTDKNGGGVALYGTNPVLVMTGGTISNNKASTGGGVELADSSAKFNMSGGIITGNAADRWGGGVDIRKGTFELSDGVISRNTLKDKSFRYGTQVCVGLYSTNCSGTFNMTGGTITRAIPEASVSYEVSGDVTVSYGTANINSGIIAGQMGTLGIPFGPATLNISGGTINGDVTNAIILPTNTSNDSNTDDTQDGMEASRKACTINITGGKINGAVVETSNANRKAVTTTTISGGKFSGATERDTLVSFLPANMGALSVMDIAEGNLIYEVSGGFYSTGEYMNFGSSLDLGLYLSADAGVDFTQIDLADYTAAVSGGYEADLAVVDGNLIYTAKGIAAKEMRDDITFTLKKKATGTVVFTKTLSVYDAAESWYAGNENMQTMLADMIHYGTQTQKYFGYYNKAVLAKPDLAGTSAGVTGEWTATSEELVTEGYESKVKFSLSLKEQIELNVYICAPQATVSGVRFGGTGLSGDKYSVTSDGTYTCVSFHEIPVTQVKDAVSFTVDLGNHTTFDVNYSIVDYILQEKGGAQSELLIALQKYVDSVCAFLGN